MQYIIPHACDGMLLRTYLCRELCLSRRLLTRLKTTPDGILLDGRPVTVRAVLHAQNVLSLAIEDEAEDMPTSVVPNGVLPPVLYEDEHLLVCNKPGNMPTHPSHGHFDDTLANAVAAYDMAKEGRIRVFRPITRLDRETSGVVLIARDRLAALRLSRGMREHQLKKTYLAVLDGIPTPAQGVIDAPIRRAQESIITREICSPDAEGAHTAQTRYRTLAVWETDGHARALVEAHPQTGRTHQLRLHFAHLGTPIAGDGLYGRDDLAATLTPPRQCLHAYSLTFAHPITGEPLTIVAPLPDDMARYIPAHICRALQAPPSHTSPPSKENPDEPFRGAPLTL